jgi:hypothetical protein
MSSSVGYENVPDQSVLLCEALSPLTKSVIRRATTVTACPHRTHACRMYEVLVRAGSLVLIRWMLDRMSHLQLDAVPARFLGFHGNEVQRMYGIYAALHASASFRHESGPKPCHKPEHLVVRSSRGSGISVRCAFSGSSCASTLACINTITSTRA